MRGRPRDVLGTNLCRLRNDDARGTYNINSQIKSKTSVLKLSLCDFSDTYMLVNGRIIITRGPENTTDANKRKDERSKGVLFKNYAPFTDSKGEVNNTQIDNARDLHVVRPMYNLTRYCYNYSKTSASLCQYYIDELDAAIVNSESFKFKIKVTGKTSADCNTKDVKIAVPL